ncbi:MAG: hypothetical protein LBQ03_00040 [Puniceicoccales bacterium]|nr:hypothetical protein [Puniceicoccales bacterium]
MDCDPQTCRTMGIMIAQKSGMGMRTLGFLERNGPRLLLGIRNWGNIKKPDTKKFAGD